MAPASPAEGDSVRLGLILLESVDPCLEPTYTGLSCSIEVKEFVDTARVRHSGDILLRYRVIPSPLYPWTPNCPRLLEPQSVGPLFRVGPLKAGFYTVYDAATSPMRRIDTFTVRENSLQAGTSVGAGIHGRQTGLLCVLSLDGRVLRSAGRPFPAGSSLVAHGPQRKAARLRIARIDRAGISVAVTANTPANRQRP